MGATESSIYSLNGQQQGGSATIGGSIGAALWSGTPLSFTNLAPPGAIYSVVYGIAGSTQAGAMQALTNEHAGLWSGTANSFLDLNPVAAISSDIYGMAGVEQVGSARLVTGGHAALWRGTAGSFVDLAPEFPIYRVSLALGTSGSQQAGECPLGPNGEAHACLWSGTADSRVDLHPAGSLYSYAYCTDGTNQAGVASINGDEHAGIWSGTAQSFADLHPSGATKSLVLSLSGSRQAGRAYFGTNSHAALWSGTAQSFVDLHTVLASSYTQSTAAAIYVSGDTTYVGGWAKPVGSPYIVHAMLWTIQPSSPPPSLVLNNFQSLAGTNVLVLTWTNNCASCILEATDLLPGTWATLSTPRTTNNNYVSMAITNAASIQFYRLRATDYKGVKP